MILDPTDFVDPKANLAYDDELLRRAEQGVEEYIRFWESSSYCVVLGRTCQEALEVNGPAVQADAIPVLRRSSGGGTVLQGPGCLNFTLILSKKERPGLDAILASYRIILDRVVLAMVDLGVDADFRPICDLVLTSTNRKFSGNAQRRGRTHILHHGTILYNFDLDLISKYLKVPPKMPDYRQLRPHSQFVTNISARREDIQRAIASQFCTG